MATPAIIPQPTGNPLLDNPALKAALVQKMAQGAQPSGPPPMPAPSAISQAAHPAIGGAEPQEPVTLPSGQPMAPGGSPSPHVIAPRGTVEGDENERGRLLANGSGISRIAHNIEGTSFGQNHPVLGKIAGVGLQGLATLGDTALSLTGPGRIAESMIPGTSGYHAAQLAHVTGQLNQDEAGQEKQAQTAEMQAKVPFTEAQTQGVLQENANRPQQEAQKAALTDAQIASLLHPQAKTEFEDWRQQNPTAPTEDFLRLQGGAKNQKPDTPEQQFIDEFTRTNPKGTIADAVHAYAAATQKPERAPTVIQTNSEVDRLGGRLGKPYETMATQAQGKFDRIDQTARSVDAGYVGQGLAIPELLTALVSGQGTGVRITQPELNAITAARGIKGDAESFFNNLAGKGKLTDEDKAQIKSVLNDARARLIAKQQIANDALDKINGAGSREDIVNADREARQKFMQIEKFGHYEGEQVTVKGKPVTINKIHPDGSFE